MSSDELHHGPRPSVWPCTLAAGVALLAFGVVSEVAFMLLGLLLIGLAVGGWVRDLWHD